MSLEIFQPNHPIVWMDKLRFPRWETMVPTHRENKGLHPQPETLPSPPPHSPNVRLCWINLACAPVRGKLKPRVIKSHLVPITL